MKRQGMIKKTWTTPMVHVLSIKKDTYSGIQVGAEKAGKSGPPAKKS